MSWRGRSGTAFALCSTAFVAKTLPLPCVFHCLRVQATAFVLCTTFAAKTPSVPSVFHCLRGYDTAFALYFPLPSWLRHCLCRLFPTAFAANTPPLPVVSHCLRRLFRTAFVAKRLPFAGCFHRLCQGVTESGVWRISDLNKDWELCPSYPATLVRNLGIIAYMGARVLHGLPM